MKTRAHRGRVTVKQKSQEMKEIIRMLACVALPERVSHELCEIQKDAATGPTERHLRREILVSVAQERLTFNISGF